MAEGRSEVILLTASILAMTVIFVMDFLNGPGIQLRALYIFPLAILALYCPKLGTAILGLIVTTILQIVIFIHDAIYLSVLITNVCVALAVSLLVILLARSGRKNYLMAVSQATSDPLTSLPNRRKFTSELDLEIARQKRYGGTFSLAVLDLDRFKELNDSKGHLAGDDALKLMGGILKRHTREADFVARLGGDELAILMPNTQDVHCSRMFRNLRYTISARMADAGFGITASIGCKTFAAPPESTTAALQKADAAMYEAKNRGKNRIVFR